ncbi:hypothetical protein OAQ62_00555 [bacterium]|nr:hypothetical protein [bacterium]
MKNRYYILAGIVYTLVVGFVVETVTYRVASENIKQECFIDGCTKVYEFTGEVGGEEWEELIVIAEEYQEEAEMWKEDAEAKWESEENPYYKAGSDSDADAYINLFMMLADPINWLFTFIISSFIAGFYLTFYSGKLWIERYFRRDNGED